MELLEVTLVISNYAFCYIKHHTEMQGKFNSVTMVVCGHDLFVVLNVVCIIWSPCELLFTGFTVTCKRLMLSNTRYCNTAILFL